MASTSPFLCFFGDPLEPAWSLALGEVGGGVFSSLCTRWFASLAEKRVGYGS